MDLRQLRYFAGVVEAGSVTRAASHLSVAQSAISHHVTRLESELGCQLLSRGQNGALPTKAGLVLYNHACRLLRHVDLARDDVASAEGGLAGEVAIGFPPVLSPLLSYRLFMQVLDLHPGVRLRLIDGGSGTLRELVQTARLDGAILFTTPQERGLDVRPLATEELFYVSSELSRTSIGFEELATRTVLLPSRTSSITQALTREMARRHLSIISLGEVDSMSTLKQAAASGVAATVLPWSCIVAEELADSLNLAPFEDGRLFRPVTLCMPNGAARSDAVLTVLAILEGIVLDLVMSGKWKGATLHAPG